MLEIEKSCSVLRGGDIHVIIIDMWIIMKKINESLRFAEKSLIFARYISGAGKSNDDFALGLIFQG